ncbi:MAG TPA: hypothetical protein PKM21_07610 [Anaerolineales bacterium]|nr:hypothetical protein [Anaerolineales bacterium]
MPDLNQNPAHTNAVMAYARQLAARLERLSADSAWAHRASGIRGALLRGIEQVEKRPGSGPAMNRLERLVEQSHQVLTSAAREIEEPKSSGG